MQKIDKTTELKNILNKHYSVDYFQREYRWGQKQIEQMLSDFQNEFEKYYDMKHDTTSVKQYGYYYMGSIVVSNDDNDNKIVDGQQILTSLTLLLIYLNNLQKELKTNPQVDILKSLIYSDNCGVKEFNISVKDRKECLECLFENKINNYTAKDESTQNMLDRYLDIVTHFPDDLKKEKTLPIFIYWIIEKILLLEIITPSDDAAHTIFLTMNDRGLSLNSAEMMKAYIIQKINESERITVNQK